MKVTRVLSAVLFAITLVAMPAVSFVTPAAAAAERVESLADHADVMHEVMGMMKETILINQRLYHDAEEADKARIDEMALRLSDIEAELAGPSDGETAMLRDVAGMLRESMKMTKKVIHAYPTDDKARLAEMKGKLDSTMLDYNVKLLREGRTEGIEGTLGEVMGMMSEIMDVMLDMKHTVPTRAEKSRLADMAGEVDAMMVGEICEVATRC